MTARASNHPKTVIVLGAGASAADGAPLQGDVFQKYFRQRPGRRSRHSWDDEICQFFSDFFGIDVQDNEQGPQQFPTFEEILGILEIAVSQDESFKDWGTSHIVDAQQKPRVQHVHELLVFLMAETLDASLRNGWEHHGKLLSKLHEAAWLQHLAFISLNYDILIDNAILDLHPDWDIDYHADFSNVEMAPDMPESTWHKPRPDCALRLLKLHGSLNWLFCPTCRTLALTPKRKKVCKLKWQPEECCCTKCETLAVPIVIPPTYFKVLSNLYLRQIWHAAEQELLASGRIIFCGYSFPDADMHIKYLLKRAEVNRMGSPPTMFVVNDHERKTDQQREMEKDRYVRFFRQKGQVHWTDLSFQDFATNPQAVEDHTRWQ